MSIDGRIAAANGESRYISAEGSLALSQELRRDHDAILIGIGTALKDDPSLTCRIQANASPVRVILDSRLSLPPDSQLVRTATEVPVLIYCSRRAAESSRAASLIEKNVQIRGIATDGEERLELASLLSDLHTRGIGSVMVEGGAAVLTAFVGQRLWDRMLIVAAPLLLGSGVEALGDIGVRSLDEAQRPQVREIRMIGNEVIWDLMPSGGVA